MPRNVDPGTIRVGKGLAPEGTVEDNSLRYPERDADPLRVHIHDPSRAHMASSIGIVDELDCYVSDEVEGALQELCGNSAAGRLNGLIAGGTFSELGCLPNGTAGGVHATLTLCAPTEILMNGTVLDATGLTVSVPAANITYFIYLDTHPPSPTYRELVAATGSPPQVEVGDPDATSGPGSIENVMLAKVEMDVGGNVVSWQDARFFVRNLDRKVTYSSRQGENVDAWSEGCFANLQAFFFWAEYYGDGALPSSNEEEKGMVLIRGTHTILSTLNVPTDHLQFVGDGEAVIELTGNAAFDGITLTNKDEITFRNITFLCNVASTGSRAIFADGSFDGLTVEGCRFLSGTQNFSLALALRSGGPFNERVLVRDCEIQAVDCGVNVDGFGTTDAWGARVENCSIDGAGAPGGSVGIQLGGSSTNGIGTITGCFISGFEYGIKSEDSNRTLIDGNDIRDVILGILYDNANASDHRVVNNRIELGDNQTIHGIFFGPGNTNILVAGNHIRSLIDGNHAGEPYGIGVRGVVAIKDVNVRIENNSVIGFYDATTTRGHGIWVEGSDGICEGATITGNTLERNGIAIQSWDQATITGNTIDGEYLSMAPAPTVGGAIDLLNVRDVTVTGNSMACVDVVRHGVYARIAESLTVTGNTVLRPTVTGILIDSADPAFGAGNFKPKNFTVTGNTVDALPLAAQSLPTADGIVISGTSDDGSPQIGVVDGNSVRRCRNGILLTGFARTVPIVDVTVSNNIVNECAKDQDTQDIWDFQDAGTFGIGCLYAESIVISGNNIGSVGQVTNDAGAPINPANNVFPQALFALNCTLVTAQGNHIRNSLPFGAAGEANDIAVLSGRVAANVTNLSTKIEGNSILTNDGINAADHTGILVWADNPGQQALFRDLSVTGNTIHTADGGSGDGIGDGIHIISQDNGGFEQTRIEGNTVENYLNRGIYLDVGGSGTPGGSSQMSVTTVKHNNLQSMNASGPQAAIYTTALTDGIYIKRIYMLTIESNTIQNSWGQGIYFTCLAADTTTAGYLGLDTITVADNEIDKLSSAASSGATALAFVLDGGANEKMVTGFPGWTTPGLRNFSVLRNRFTDVGRGFDLLGEDVRAWANFTIDDNYIAGTGSNHLTPTTDYLSRVQLTLTDNTAQQTLENWSISRNNCQITASDRQLDNWRFLTENAFVSVFRVEDNQINGSGVNASPNEHGRAFYYLGDNQKNAAVSTDHKEVSIKGNMLGGGLYWEARNSNLYTMDVQDNQITVPEVDAATPEMGPLLVFQNGYDVDNLLLRGVSIRGNTLAGGTYGCWFEVDDTFEAEAIAITDNLIQEAHTCALRVGIDQSSGVSYHSEYVRNLKITDNTLTNNTITSTTSKGIFYSAGKASTQSLEVTGNQIKGQQERAVQCRFGGNLPLGGNSDRSISVQNNAVDYCGISAAALPVVALEMDPAAATTSDDIISSMVVSNNTLTSCGNVAGNIGFYFDFTQYGSALDLTCDENIITNPVGVIINPGNIGSAIELDLPNTKRLSVSRNQLRIEGFDPDTTEGYGIYLQCFGNTLDGITLNENTITASDNADGGIRVRVTGDGNLGVEDFSASRNQIRAVAAGVVDYGIQWDGEDGSADYAGIFENVHLNDNQITNCRAGIRIKQSLDDYKHARLTLKNCSADRNYITDCETAGVHWEHGNTSSSGLGGNVHGMSMSGNQVVTQRPNTLAGPDDLAMVNLKAGRSLSFAAGNCNVHQVSVDNNHCYLTVAVESPNPPKWTGVMVAIGAVNSTGTALGYSPSSISTVSVDGNHVRNVGVNGVNLEMTGYWTLNAQNQWTDITTARAISLSNNLITGTNNQYTSVNDIDGLLRCSMIFCVAQNFNIHGNQVRGFADAATSFQMAASYTGNTADPADPIRNRYWSVQGNTIIGSKSSAVVDVTWDGNIPFSGTVIGNSNTEVTGAGSSHNFDAGDWTFLGSSIQALNNKIV